MSILSGTNLLVVEDDAIIGLDLVCFLEDQGCRVRGPVASATQALDAISDEEPDIATLDFNLRGDETSAVVAKALVGLSRPFIYVTADAEPLSQMDIPEAPTVLKPINFSDLLAVLVDRLNLQGAKTVHSQAAQRF